MNFDTFHINSVFVSFVIFELNDESLVCLCRDSWHGVLAKAARVANGALLQLKNLKIALDLLHTDEIDNFSSKQSFEEKIIIEHYDDEILE